MITTTRLDREIRNIVTAHRLFDCVYAPVQISWLDVAFDVASARSWPCTPELLSALADHARHIVYPGVTQPSTDLLIA